MTINKYSFDVDLVKALQDIDSIPTTDPSTVPGIPGRLFIVAPTQKEQLVHIINVLSNIPQEEFSNFCDSDKLFYGSLLNNAERVLANCICRPATKHVYDVKS